MYIKCLKNWVKNNDLDNLIHGRSDPRIYAFATKDAPMTLKIGDTTRHLNLRIKEWKRIYQDADV